MIQLQINNRKMYIDGKEVVLDVPPVISNSRTLVPIRAIAEGFGFSVNWDNDTKTVTIYGRKKYFDTIDACAYDWGMHWNAMSIALFKEMNGVIYKDENGYYWDSVRIGKDKEVVFDTVEAKKGVALIHSHSGGEHWNTKNMSGADCKTAERFDKPLYMVDSAGYLWVYNPTEKNPTQRLITMGCPKDARWESIDNTLINRYFANGYYELKEYEFGYKADYYNKLYMNGLNYTKEGVQKC